MEQRHLKIRLDDFLTALAMGLDGVDGGWFLDLDNGEILLAGDGAELSLKDMADEARYMLIGQIDSKSGFRIMEKFVAQLEDARAADRLGNALRGRKPFRAFKDALSDFPDHRTAWFAFEQAAHRREADAWCEANDIVVEWV